MSEPLKGEKDIININHMYLMSPKKITNHWSPVIQVLTWMAFLFTDLFLSSIHSIIYSIYFILYISTIMFSYVSYFPLVPSFMFSCPSFIFELSSFTPISMFIIIFVSSLLIFLPRLESVIQHIACLWKYLFP